ncbi:MAG TPA: ROK family protein [Nakamurella sp.]|nr:ROK family protein [Nakamurella sp.]
MPDDLAAATAGDLPRGEIPAAAGDLPAAPDGARARDVDDGPAVAAIDVGGTVIKAGLVDRGGVLRHEERHPANVDRGPDALVEAVLDIAAGLVSRGSARMVGIGVPGIVDSAAGVARYAANLGWRDVPFVDLVTERLGVPAVLGHDVRNGALAEARLGAGAGADSVYFLAIGTGIAGGQVRAGVVDDGATGQAGEIGHLVVRPGGPRCNCGNRGCLEAVASAFRIGAAYRAVTGVPASAADVARLVGEGDADAQRVWSEAIAALADALAAQIVLTDPGRIVVGGGLSLAGRVLFEPLAAALPPRLTFREAPAVVPAALGDRAGLVGAALRAWDHLAEEGER